MKEYTLCAYCIMTAFVSFLGFCLENIWMAFTQGRIDNRNMYAPFLLGYGLAIMGIYAVFGTPGKMRIPEAVKSQLSLRTEKICYFLCAFLVVCVGEILLGYTVERLCGFEYWNYDHIPLHMTKYTSVPTGIGFAAIITMFMDHCFDPCMEAISRIPHEKARVIAAILLLITVTDFIVSFYIMYSTQSLHIRWEKSVPSPRLSIERLKKIF